MINDNIKHKNNSVDNFIHISQTNKKYNVSCSKVSIFKQTIN